MRTAILALPCAAALLACNLSSTVGSNQSGGSGGTGATSTGDGPASTTGSGTQSTSAQTTSTQSTSAQATSATTTSSTTGGGGTIQGAHVYVHMETDRGWIQEMTLVEIRASQTAVDSEFAMDPPEACNASQVPFGTAPTPTWLDLSGASVTVSATGFGNVQAVWSATDGTLYAQFNQALPSGTPIHIAFDGSSPLLPGQALDYATRNIALDTPQLQQVMTYPAGTDWAFTWTAAPMPYLLYTFVAVTNPMNPPPTQHWVAKCAGDATATGVTMPAAAMSPIVSDLAVEPQGSEIWVSLSFLDKGPQDQAVGGNFVSSGASVLMSRPVVVSP